MIPLLLPSVSAPVLAGPGAGEPCEADYKLMGDVVEVRGIVHAVCLHYAHGTSVVDERPPTSWSVWISTGRPTPPGVLVSGGARAYAVTNLDSSGCARVCLDPSATGTIGIGGDRSDARFELDPRDLQRGVSHLFVDRGVLGAVRLSDTAQAFVLPR